MGQRLGVDVGGTFTDVQMQDTDTDEVTLVKVLSTPQDQSVGVLEGVREACRRTGASPQDLELILHGSTVVTNLILEGKGAACGLLTTPGNEQILHLARAWTPGPLYGWMAMIKPEPLAPLWHTRGIGGRMAADGDEIEPLDEDAVAIAIDELVADGVQSVTIGFLNSYVNPAHERRAREIARDRHPQLPVSISSDLVSEYREYERTLTAVLNAYVQPEVIRYVDGLERLLGEAGFDGRLGVVRSDGGTMSTLATKERPVDTAFSGPSGGVVGAAWLARRIGAPNVLTLDVGGTSTDVSVCVDGGVTIRRDVELGYFQFQSRGVDVHSVGAGGGSIAHLTPVGALRVGPQSAGAEPGPAAYGRGGTEPTVTDANVVLHRIPPSIKLGGSLALDEDAARAAVQTIADGLEVDLTTAAQAIVDIANENMHAALRVVSIERGYDPREFGLLAFGGAGPMHANALGRLIGADPVVIPATPGVLSAFGFLVADVQNEFARTYLKVAEDTPAGVLREVLGELRAEAAEWLAREGVAAQDHAFSFFADCRYYMQDIQLPCAIAPEEASNGYAELLRERFESEHRRRFGFDLDAPIEIATVRVIGSGGDAATATAEPRTSPESAPEPDRREDVFFDGEWHASAIHRRDGLAPGHRLVGPAVIEQQDTTTVIEPGYAGVVDGYGNIIIREREGRRR
ncbi:MAG: hydantoinase/oxoprolinase family protein [Solirubrobacterales bacterium]|nr:hydantoinase/oxoprolinase family protein [Solirubrobacterales bacterium]